MPMGKRSINKKIEFQRYPPKVFRARFLWARLENKNGSKLLESPKKANLGPNIGLRKTEADLVRNGEIPSP